MILVTGTIDIDPDQRDAFVELLKPLMATTRAEAGCDHYSFAGDVEDPGRFYIAERWETEEAMQAHSASEHLATFMGAVGAMARGASLTQWAGATPTTIM
jgi:quinol monooxygenase YgiN